MISHTFRGLAAVMAAALCLAVAGCPKNANPDTPPPPEGTAMSRVGTDCPFKVSASDPDLNRVSARIDWDDGDTSDWSDYFGSTDTTTLGHIWSAPGDYRISAQARDEKGAVSAWSNWHAVLIKDTVNVPPGMPTTPAGPDTGYVDSTCEFSAVAGDENGDRLRLQFDWGDGDTSDCSGLVAESTQVTATHVWLQAGEFSIVARAMDEKGLIGGWSNVHLLTISDSLP